MNKELKNSSEINKGKLAIQPIVICVNDEAPHFKVNDWIERGKVYVIDRIVGDVKSKKCNYIVKDVSGKVIVPHEQVPAIMHERFSATQFYIGLN